MKKVVLLISLFSLILFCFSVGYAFDQEEIHERVRNALLDTGDALGLSGHTSHERLIWANSVGEEYDYIFPHNVPDIGDTDGGFKIVFWPTTEAAKSWWAEEIPSSYYERSDEIHHDFSAKTQFHGHEAVWKGFGPIQVAEVRFLWRIDRFIFQIGPMYIVNPVKSNALVYAEMLYAKSQSIFGDVDSDGDGILDSEDECPVSKILAPFTELKVDPCGCTPHENINRILDMYNQLDLTGQPFPNTCGNEKMYGSIANLSTYFSLTIKDGKKIEVDGRTISIDTTAGGGITCREYQTLILEWLDTLRASDTQYSECRNYHELFAGVSYGPIMTYGGAHNVVVIYPSGTDWQETGTVLDPWYTQSTKAYPIKEWPGGGWLAAHHSWLSIYSGKYGTTGYSHYADEEYALKEKKDYKAAQNLQDQLMEDIRESMEDLKKLMNPPGGVKGIVECKIDLRITDTQTGNRMGRFNGEYVNEIPGGILDAYQLTEEEGDFIWDFSLPAGIYEIEIEGIGDGDFRLLTACEDIGLMDYGTRPIANGSIAHANLNTSDPRTSLILPDGNAVSPVVIMSSSEDVEAPKRFDFNDGQLQGWTDDGSELWAISEGVYTLAGDGGNELRGSYYDQELADFTFQADMRKVSGDGNGYLFGYGLHFRSDGSPRNYYEFNIVYDGRYMIAKGVDWQFHQLVEWTASDALRSGYNQWNTLKVVVQGNTLKFYANGTLLTTIQDDTFSTGKLGLFAVDAEESDEPDTVQFDNVIIGDPEMDEGGGDVEIEPGLAVVISPDTLPADGESTATITATLGDANGDPIDEGEFNITFSQQYGGISDLKNNGDGTYTATFKVATQPGTATLTVRVGSYSEEVDLILTEADQTPDADRILSIALAEAAPGDSIVIQVAATDCEDIASADILIEYDPDIIEIDDVQNTDLTKSMALIVNTNIPGEARIAMAGSEGMPSGSGALLDIAVTISPDARPDTQTTFSLAEVEVYDESGIAIPVDVEDGILEIRQTGIKGDVNNDGRVRSNDATLTLRIATMLIVPDDYQKWAADMNDDGKVRANDATLILREAAGLTAPTANIFARGRNRISLAVSEAGGVSGESISVPLKVDRPGILASGEICINYDSEVLRVTDVSSDSDSLMVYNSSEPGVLRIAFACADGLRSSIPAEIKFDVIEDDVSPLTLMSADLYSPDALPLISSCESAEFRSWAMPPERSNLLQNFPNPFNPETWIPYQIKVGSAVTIRIYSVKGELIRELDLGYRAAGLYISRDRAARWDGKDRFGSDAASGVYFYSIKAGGYTDTRKMILAK